MISLTRRLRTPRPTEAPVYPEPRFRAALVQLEAVHEETLPAMVHLLRLNGVDPEVFLNDQVRENRPGVERRFPDLEDRLHYFEPEDGGWARLRRRLARQDFDLLVINTFQRDRTGRWAAKWEGPMIGLVHNPPLLRDSEPSMEVVRSGRIALLTLARHATATMMRADPVLFGSAATVSMVFPHPPAVPVEPARRRRITVPGAVNFRARDYAQLLDLVPHLRERLPEGSFEFAVVGGGADREELERLIRAQGVEDVFHLAPLNETGHVDGDDYYSVLRASDFLLPLLPTTRGDFRLYKITSTIPQALGLGVPMIMDRWTATVYDVPGVTHLPGELNEAIERALSMPAEELSALKARIEATAASKLDDAAREMAYALHAVGLGEED
jgi:hypothetical protein